jgi:hypothetical protein
MKKINLDNIANIVAEVEFEGKVYTFNQLELGTYADILNKRPDGSDFSKILPWAEKMILASCPEFNTKSIEKLTVQKIFALWDVIFKLTNGFSEDEKKT